METPNNNLSCEDFSVKLINLIKANAILHLRKTRSAPYYSKQLRKDAWTSLAASLGVDPKICLLKWKELLSRYEREKAMLKQARIKQQSHWSLFKLMSFLDDTTLYKDHLFHGTERQINSNNNKNVFLKNPQNDIDDVLQEAMDEQSTSASIINEAQTLSGNLNLGQSGNLMTIQGLMSQQAAISSPSPLTSSQQPVSIVVTTADKSVNSTVSNPVVRRIDALLEGLGADNRQLAEKRILAYLCQCQLKILNGESIVGIQF